MMTGIILTLCSLSLTLNSQLSTLNSIDLQGSTFRVSDGDVSVFDGREVKNGTFIISEGDYLIQVVEEGTACLIIGDNTEVIIDGSLRLAPNHFKSYDMIRIVGNHVKIHGKGSITGDRRNHKGKDGEWGMGIRLHGATDVTVSGLTVSDCWGDCIYIGGGSERVNINSCVLSDSRRQGVSITKAKDVTISDCRIANISGTMPQYAICIEPNKQCVVDNVLISGVTVANCEGGFRAILGKKTYGNARIGKVEISDCQVMAKSRHTIHFAGCDQAIVRDCMIETRKGEKPILSRKVGKLTEKNNKVIRN